MSNERQIELRICKDAMQTYGWAIAATVILGAALLIGMALTL